MQELVGRLTALDPEASETLKVVSYFDALVAGGVGVDALLRGAAVLSGAIAGVSTAGRILRIDPEGERLVPDPVGLAWPSRPTPSGAVWLERSGAAHANDAMVLERLALAVSLAQERRGATPESALHVVIDATRSAEERAVALSRLRVDAAEDVRVAAVPPGSAVEGPSTVVATTHGLVRAVLVPDDGGAPFVDGGCVGLGTRVRADAAPVSFAAAAVALRLADADRPVVDAAELGVLMAAVQALAGGTEHPDVHALTALDDRGRKVLSALVAAESVRAAAAALGMHHSTIQVRHDTLTRELGYDPRSAVGRARYELASLLLRLSD